MSNCVVRKKSNPYKNQIKFWRESLVDLKIYVNSQMKTLENMLEKNFKK